MKRILLLLMLLIATACSSATATLQTVSADEAAAVLASPPTGLSVIDVRTPDEFNAGHLQGATMIDFYEADFRNRLAELDPEAPYLIYCRSGNRSGETLKIMEDLGFTDVTNVAGGIVAWADAGQQIVR